MIARWPGRIAPGSVSAHVGYSGDLFATFADLLLAELEKHGLAKDTLVLF